MKRQWNRILSTVLALALLAGLAAPACAEESKLSFMLHIADMSAEAPFAAVWQGFVNAHPEIEAEYIGNNGSEEQMKKVKLAAESNALPDIFWCSVATAREMAQAGYLLDLTAYTAQSENAQKILPSLTLNFHEGDILFGLPYQAQVKGFWLNKAIFEQNGLTPPTQGTTFAELLAMVDTLRANGVTTFLNGAQNPYSCWSFLTAWARYGYYDIVPQILAGSEKFNNLSFISYFEKLEQLAQHGAFSESITTNSYDQSLQAFSDGKGAILDSGSWAAGSEALAKLGDSIGFWWGPVFEDGVGEQKIAMQIPSSPLCVSARVAEDPNKLAAVYAFLDYYYSDEAAGLCIENGAVPTIAYTGDTASNVPAYQAMMAAVNDAEWVSPYAGPDMIVSSAVQSALYDALYGMMSGVYTPAQALDNIDMVQEQQ